MATRNVISAAASQNGDATFQTKKVNNVLVDQIKRRFSLTAAGDSTATDILLKPGPHTNGAALTLNGKLTFACTTGFNSYADMVAYDQKIATECYGIQIQTNDTDNFEENILTVMEKDPSGREVKIDFDLSDYRTDSGNGWSDKIILESSDFNQIFWPGLQFSLKTIKPGTKMTFTFMLRDWNKVQELSPVRPIVMA